MIPSIELGRGTSIVEEIGIIDVVEIGLSVYKFNQKKKNEGEYSFHSNDFRKYLFKLYMRSFGSINLNYTNISALYPSKGKIEDQGNKFKAKETLGLKNTLLSKYRILEFVVVFFNNIRCIMKFAERKVFIQLRR